MKVLAVFPKDICTHLEFTMTQLNYILDYLDRCTVDSEKEPKLDKEAIKYVKEDFFSQLDKLTDSMKEQM